MFFKARDAKKIVKKFKDSGSNAQRNHFLARIEQAAKNGKNHLVLDDPLYKLFEEDYVFFESLGYVVQREKREEKILVNTDGKRENMVYRAFGSISWK